MDKKSKIFLTLVFVAVCLSIGVTYYKSVILNQYEVYLDPDEVPSMWDVLSS